MSDHYALLTHTLASYSKPRNNALVDSVIIIVFSVVGFSATQLGIEVSLVSVRVCSGDVGV